MLLNLDSKHMLPRWIYVVRIPFLDKRERTSPSELLPLWASFWQLHVLEFVGLSVWPDHSFKLQRGIDFSTFDSQVRRASRSLHLREKVPLGFLGVDDFNDTNPTSPMANTFSLVAIILIADRATERVWLMWLTAFVCCLNLVTRLLWYIVWVLHAPSLSLIIIISHYIIIRHYVIMHSWDWLVEPSRRT